MKFSFSRPSILALGCALALPLLAAEPGARLPAPRPAPRPVAPAPRVFATLTPFVLVGGIDDLPAVRPEDVRLFEGDAAFRRFAEASDVISYPIGRFIENVHPANEAEFREVLRRHAAAQGADFVVVLTDAAEVQRLFQHPSLGEEAYGAIAYRRVRARLGVTMTSTPVGGGAPTVAAFVAGSFAETDGLRVGDVLLSVAGETVSAENAAYWQHAVRWSPGQEVPVRVRRAGQPLDLTVRVMGR